MKKAPPVRLSLRKLFIAMLAVGPVSILPTPLLAAVPAAQPFTVVNGNVAWSGSGTLGSINASSNNAILSWGLGNFNIQSGDTFNFSVPSGGAILNKVGYNSAGNALAGIDTAIINGSLQSNGRVFILANGNINIGAGAQISTQGLYLSTIPETDNFNFTALGNLSFTPGANPTGAITIGNSTTAVNVIGTLGAWGSVALDHVNVSGDLIVNQRTAGATLSLTGPNGNTTVSSGNLIATTSNGTIQQNTGALIVGNTTTLNTNGPAVATLNGATNQFSTITGNVGGLTIRDSVGDINLGNLTVAAGGLAVTAVGNIGTTGTVNATSSGNVSLVTSGANTVTLANNSSLSGGTFSAASAGGAINADVVGPIIVGAVAAPTSHVYVTTNAAASFTGAITGGAATVKAAAINSSASGSITATIDRVSLTSTNGSVVLPTLSAPRVEVQSTNGSISQLANTTLTMTTANTVSTFNAGTTGSITLGNAGNIFNGSELHLMGTSATITGTNNGTNTNTGNITIGASTLSGSLTINTTASAEGLAPVRLGAGFGTAATDMTVGGSLNITTNGSNVVEDLASTNNVFGSVNIDTTNARPVGAILGINLSNTGSGYTAAPTITFSMPTPGGVQAVGTAAINGSGQITGITITNPGSGYVGTPSITIAGGNTTTSINAAASANVLSGGTVSFTAASAGASGGGRYGQFNITSREVNLQENTTLNLGTINTRSLTANSTGGDLLINGAINAATFNARASSGAITQGSGSTITLGGASTFNSSNSFGTNLSSSTNSFGGGVTIVNGGTNIIVSGNAIAFSPGNVTGGSITVNTVNAGTAGQVTFGLSGVNANATDVRINAAGPIIIASNDAGRPLVRNLTLNTTDTTTNSIRQNNGAYLTANGTVTIATQGGVLLNQVGNNLTGPVILNNVVGNVSVYSARNLTISGSTQGTLEARAGTGSTNSFSNAWNVFLGNLNVSNLLVSAMNSNSAVGQVGNATAGNSGNITQLSGTRIHVENVADFSTFNGNIIIANNGNNFGRVQASTGGALTRINDARVNLLGVVGSGEIRIVEDAGLKVGQIMTNGAASLTSRFGPVLEDSDNNVEITVNGTSPLTVTASAGSILLGNINRNNASTHTGNVTAANLTAAGSAALFSTGNLTLGATSANTLSIEAANITQSAPVRVFGTTSFISGASIVLNDAGNNFGPVSLNSTTANRVISITEAGTLNLRSVSMVAPGSNTTFTANSVNGDIIDTGMGGVRLGGNYTAGAPNFGSGVVTLTAANGNIIIDDFTSDIMTSAGVVFNANNVTLSVLGSPSTSVILGANTSASAATGNLTVRVAQGNIGNLGQLRVGGTATFEAGTGNISINQPNVGFGLLKFTGNQVQIIEAGNMDIASGSSAVGPAQLISGGNIQVVAVDTQSVTFGNSVSLQASGDITLRQTQVVGALTLQHTGTANLSAISKSTDLNGRDPVDAGTGPYVPPQP